MPQVHDVSEYLQQEIHPPPFYVVDILPKGGVWLCFGSPKMYKSWLAMHTAFCLATGSDWLGLRVEQCKILIAQFEISSVAYHWRLSKVGQHFTLLPQHLFELSPGLTYLDDEQHFARFTTLVDPIQPNVIILDCLAACFGGDENDSGQIGHFIGKIEELKQRYNCSIILIHHTRKMPAITSFAEVARGTSRLAGWADTLSHIGTMPEGRAVGLQMQFLCRQATRDVGSINFRFDNYLFQRR